jgi:hypothetical protein
MASDYLRGRGLDGWAPEIVLMIVEHHKLRRFTDARYPLVEVMRRADLIDLTLGALRFGLPGSFVRRVKAQYPNSGFHKRLVGLVAQGFRQRPLKPLPYYKW